MLLGYRTRGGLQSGHRVTFVTSVRATPARQALARGDLAAAAQAGQALVRGNPGSAEGYFVLAMVALEAGHPDKALPMLERALACGPEAEHLAQKARLLILLHRDGEALEAAREALELAPQDARTLDTIGCVLARLGDHEGSVAPFEGAISKEPANLDFRYNLAAACGFTGRTDQARSHYEAILQSDPGNARVHYALAILSRQRSDANHIPRLSAALAAAAVPNDRLRLRYALAKEHEDIGEPQEAYRHLAQANADHKRTIGYDFSHDEAIFDAIEAAFAGDLPASPGHPDPSPIFIVGMPRTGTTLVDRIISSHPAVGSAGELQAMPLAVKQLAGTSSRQVIDPETVAASMQVDPADIGRAYIERAAHHRPAGTPRFVDKLPANFLYTGHILRALPQARVICLRRHPMDTVWSNYKNLFASQSAYYAYSYDLMDTARYYARFDRLMQMWERVFPGRVLSFSYEALVSDQEGETRRLLDHCGLPWDPACLDFHTNAAAVATPSAAQVRRPLNADAVGRWKVYQSALTPISDWFSAQGIDIA